MFSPGEGFHLFVLDGRLMWMKREVQVANAIIEKISLSTLGRDKAPLEPLVDAAMEHRIARELNRIAIYVPSPYSNEWTRARLGNNRKLDSVVLKAGQKEAIVGDLERFFASRERYETLGIPWRRGYLLYGPPGTGKTSLVTALASELALNVCVLSLASPNVTDEKIGNLLASVPRRSIILIEDVDAFFQQRAKADVQVQGVLLRVHQRARRRGRARGVGGVPHHQPPGPHRRGRHPLGPRRLPHGARACATATSSSACSSSSSTTPAPRSASPTRSQADRGRRRRCRSACSRPPMPTRRSRCSARRSCVRSAA